MIYLEPEKNNNLILPLENNEAEINLSFTNQPEQEQQEESTTIPIQTNQPQQPVKNITLTQPVSDKQSNKPEETYEEGLTTPDIKTINHLFSITNKKSIDPDNPVIDENTVKNYFNALYHLGKNEFGDQFNPPKEFENLAFEKGFGKGFKSGLKQIKYDFQYLSQELSKKFDENLVYELDDDIRSGIWDTSKSPEQLEQDLKFFREKEQEEAEKRNQLQRQPSALSFGVSPVFDTTSAINNQTDEEKFYAKNATKTELWLNLLKQFDGDTEQAKQFLHQFKSSMAPHEAKQREIIKEKFNIPEGKGLFYDIGNMAPQVAPIAISMAVSPVAGSTVSGILGTVVGTAMASMTAADALMNYDQYMHDKGYAIDPKERFGISISAGIVEYLTEKIPFDKVSKRLVKGTLMKTILSEGGEKGFEILEKYLPKDSRLKVLYNKAIKLLAEGNNEGLEEVTSEINQILGEHIYQDKADWQSFNDMANRIKQSYVGGAMMRAMLVPGEVGIQHAQRKIRWNNQGVNLASAKDGTIFEVLNVDYDKNNPKNTVYHGETKDGREVEYKASELDHFVHFEPDEVKQYNDALQTADKAKIEATKQNIIEKRVQRTKDEALGLFNSLGVKTVDPNTGNAVVKIADDKYGNSWLIIDEDADNNTAVVAKFNPQTSEISDERKMMNANDFTNISIFDTDQLATEIAENTRPVVTEELGLNQPTEEEQTQQTNAEPVLPVGVAPGKTITFRNQKYVVSEIKSDGKIYADPVDYEANASTIITPDQYKEIQIEGANTQANQTAPQAQPTAEQTQPEAPTAEQTQGQTNTNRISIDLQGNKFNATVSNDGTIIIDNVFEGATGKEEAEQLVHALNKEYDNNPAFELVKLPKQTDNTIEKPKYQIIAKPNQNEKPQEQPASTNKITGTGNIETQKQNKTEKTEQKGQPETKTEIKNVANTEKKETKPQQEVTKTYDEQVNDFINDFLKKHNEDVNWFLVYRGLRHNDTNDIRYYLDKGKLSLAELKEFIDEYNNQNFAKEDVSKIMNTTYERVKESYEESLKKEAKLQSEKEAKETTPKAKEAAPTMTEKQPETKAETKNVVFTEEAYEAALKRLKERFGRLNAGIDPTILSDGIIVGGFYVEKGIHKFAEWSKKMLEAVGKEIQPYLKSIYRAVKTWPGMEEYAKNMDSDEYIEKYNFEQEEKPETQLETQMETQNKQESLKDITELKEESKSEVPKDKTKVYIDNEPVDFKDAVMAYFQLKNLLNVEIKNKKAAKDENYSFYNSELETLGEAIKKYANAIDEYLKNNEAPDPELEKQYTESRKKITDKSPLLEYKQTKHTKTGETLHVGIIKFKVVNYKDLVRAVNEIDPKAYYSTFVKGFIFSNEELAKKAIETIHAIDYTIDTEGIFTPTVEKAAKETYQVAKDLLNNKDKVLVIKVPKNENTKAEIKYEHPLTDSDRLLKYPNSEGDIYSYTFYKNGKLSYTMEFAVLPNEGVIYPVRVDEQKNDGKIEHGEWILKGVIYQGYDGGNYESAISAIKQTFIIAKKYGYGNEEKPETNPEAVGQRVQIIEGQEKAVRDEAEARSNEARNSGKTERLTERLNEVKQNLNEVEQKVDNLINKIVNELENMGISEKNTPKGTNFEQETNKPESNGRPEVSPTVHQPANMEQGEQSRNIHEQNTRGGAEKTNGESKPSTGLRGNAEGKGNTGRPDTGTGERLSNAGTRSGGEAISEGEVPKNSQSNLSGESANSNAVKENHIIAPDDVIVPKGKKAKMRANIEAIRILKQCQKENRQATPEEKKKLAQYTGWGGLADIFNSDEYAEEYRELSELLTYKELGSIKKSTINAFYTSKPVIQAMWKMAEKLGFKGGIVLEPAAGVGHFMGFVPENLRSKTKFKAVELDKITGEITQLLYPNADVSVTGFQDVNVKPNSIDMAITNVPFGNIRVYDPNNKDISSKFNLHNYFIAKIVRALKPNGIAIVITTSSTMDNGGQGTDFRKWLVNEGNAELVDAIRLPNNAFKDNAGTEITTDILIIRKLDTGETAQNNFINIEKVGEGKVNDKVIPIYVNEFFAQHPDRVLGKMAIAGEVGSGALYSAESTTCAPVPDIDVEEKLNEIADKIKPVEHISTTEITPQIQAAKEEESKDKHKENELFVKGGKIYQKVNGELVEYADVGKNVANKIRVLQSYKSISDSLHKLIELENNPESSEKEIEAERKRLNDLYDDFVKKYGTLNNNRAVSWLSDDVDFYRIAAIENVTTEITYDLQNQKVKKNVKITKSDIFNKRVINPKAIETKAETIDDAIKFSFTHTGKFDIDYISKLLGKNKYDVIQEMLDKGYIFENPETGVYEYADDYLSGNVVRKLDFAKNAAKDNPKYEANVRALEKVQPKRKSINEIGFKLGSTWIDPAIVERWAFEYFNYPSYYKFSVKYIQDVGWVVDYNKHATSPQIASSEVKGMSPFALLEHKLNNQSTVIRKKVENNKFEQDKEAMSLAEAKKQEFENSFKEWCYKNEDVYTKLEDKYNEIYNSTIPRKDIPKTEYYPGANTNIKLREHQKRAVDKCLAGSTLIAHQVGTGKTYTLITAAMEMRRLGLARKPMIVVQKATLPQFVESIYKLYPNAKVLVPRDKDMSASERNKFLNKIAYGDYDIVVVTHDNLRLIPDKPERLELYIQEQIDRLNELKQESNNDRNTIREIDNQIKQWQNIGGKKKNKKGATSNEEYAAQEIPIGNVKQNSKEEIRIEESIKKQAGRRTANVFYFEDLGIDALLIDEAHTYKRLGFISKLNRIRGIDKSKSQKSLSALMKVRYIQEKKNGKNVVMATGTPISNTAAEIWTFMYYLMPDKLREFGMYTFDAFASNFGDISESIELGTNGKLRIVTRFKNYHNLNELRKIFGLIADVALTKDIPELKEGIGTPSVEIKPFEKVIIPYESEPLKNIMNRIIETLRIWEKMSGGEKMKLRHIPLVMFTRAKQAAIDVRLYDSSLPDDPKSKVNIAVGKIYDIYKETDSYKGTQLVFCDTYMSSDGKFNLYNDIKDKLVKKGIPANEIAIITEWDSEAKRKALFEMVNQGTIRVVIGSTEKLGIGVNVQDRLNAIHNLDAPNRPMDFEQRMGRIVRQGNMHLQMNKPVRIIAYGVEKTLDANVYQRLAIKLNFIHSIMDFKSNVDNVEEEDDISGLDFNSMMAELTGDEKMMVYVQKKNELQKLILQKKGFESQKKRIKNEVPVLQANLEHRKEMSEYYEKLLKNLDPDNVTIIFENKKVNLKDDKQIEKIENEIAKQRGSIFEFVIEDEPFTVISNGDTFLVKSKFFTSEYVSLKTFLKNVGGRLKTTYEYYIRDNKAAIIKLKDTLKSYESIKDDVFPYEEKLNKLKEEVAILQNELSEKDKENTEEAQSIDDLESIERELEQSEDNEEDNEADNEADNEESDSSIYMKVSDQPMYAAVQDAVTGEIIDEDEDLNTSKTTQTIEENLNHKKEQVKAIVTNMANKLHDKANMPKFEVVRNEVELIQAMQRNGESPESIKYMIQFHSKGMTINGLNTKKAIYFVSDNMENSSDVITTFIHEIIGHQGFRAIFKTTEQYAKFGKYVYDIVGEEEIKRVVPSEYWNKSKHELGIEYVAYISEKVVKQKQLTSNERTIWQKIVDAILDFLRTNFNLSSKWSINLENKLRDEIPNFIYDAIQASYDVAVKGMDADKANKWMTGRLIARDVNAFKKGERAILYTERRDMPYLSIKESKSEWKEEQPSNMNRFKFNGKDSYMGIVHVPSGTVLGTISWEEYKDANARHMGYMTKMDSGYVGSPDFQRFLVDSDGKVIGFIEPLPESTTRKIEKQIEIKNQGEDTFARIGNKPQFTEEEEFEHEKTKFIDNNWKKFLEAVQDRMLSVKYMQDLVKARGGVIDESSNPYDEENLSISRAKAAIEKYNKNQFNNLLKTISDFSQKYRIDIDEINEYLINKHAPERNEYLEAKYNVKNGSGIATEDAEQFVEEFESDKDAADIEKLWSAVREATKFSIDKAMEYGFINEAVHDEILGRYQYYVPLRGWQLDENDDANIYDYITSDLKPLNNPLKTAKGRQTVSDSPLKYISSMANTTIVVGEKNRIKQAAFRLINKNLGMKDLFTAKKVYTVMNPTTGEVYETIEKPENEDDIIDFEKSKKHFNKKPIQLAKQHEVEVYVNGQKYILIFSDPDVANAINKKNFVAPSNIFWEKYVGITRWLSTNFTAKSPAFIPVNFIRDLGYALISKEINPEYKDVDFAKHIIPAMAATWKYLSGKANPALNKYDRYYQMFLKEGGETGFVHLKEIEDIEKEIQSNIKKLRGDGSKIDKMLIGKIGKSLGSLLDKSAVASENASRFAIFVGMMEAGKSAHEAAIAAKNITVNFNRKGVYSSVFGGLYAFFNAAVQGAANMVGLAKKDKLKFAQVSAITTSLGFMMTMLAYWRATKDQEDEKKIKDNPYFSVGDYIRDNFLTISVGDKVITIPMPQGFRAFYGLGVEMAMSMLGAKPVDKSVKNMFGNFFEAMSPINFTNITNKEGELTIRPFVPTVFIPFYDIAQNETFSGNRIYNEPFDKKLEKYAADYNQALDRVNPILKSVSEAMFRMADYDTSINSKYKLTDTGVQKIPDFIDWNPSKIEYIIEYYLGGRGKFWNDAMKTASSLIAVAKDAVQGNKKEGGLFDDIDVNHIPIAQRFIRKPYYTTTNLKYNQIREEMGIYQYIRSQYKSNKDFENYMNTKFHDVNWKQKEIIFNMYDRMINNLYNNILTKAKDAADAELIMSQISEMKEACVNQIEKLEQK